MRTDFVAKQQLQNSTAIKPLGSVSGPFTIRARGTVKLIDNGRCRWNRTIPVLVCSALLAAPALWAQKGNGGAGNSGSGNSGIGNAGNAGPSTGRSPGISTPNTPGIPTQRNPGMEDMPRPIFLSGRVLFDDGSKPSRDIVIQRVCMGNPRPEGYTDSKGHFSFQVGQNQEMLSDASTSSYDQPGFNPGRRSGQNQSWMGTGGQRQISERELQNCEIRASYPGYRSDSISLAMHRSMDNPDIGVIVLHRLGNVQGTTISMTTQLAPKKAVKAYEKGMQLAAKGKLENAEERFQEAVSEYPKYAIAWYELGRLQLARRDFEAAKKSLLAAIDADPKYVSPYDRLGVMAVQQGNWKEAADWSKHAVSLNPVEFPVSWFVNGVANYNLKDLKAAQASSEQALKADVNHKLPQIENLLAQIYYEQGNYEIAANHLREYLKLEPNAKNADALKQELLKLEQASAKPNK